MPANAKGGSAVDPDVGSSVGSNVDPPSGSLDQAVAYIEEARGALARGDISTAQHALARHGEEFARGPLVLEREGYTAMVACRRGAPSLARRFAAAHPDTRMARRVTEACAVDRISDNP